MLVFSVVAFAASVILPFFITSPDERDIKKSPSKLPAAIKNFLAFIQRYKPELLTGWFASHLLFALAQLVAPFVQSLPFATAVVATAGIPWAFAMWAPFTFMGVEVNRLTSPGMTVANGDIVMSSGGTYQPAQVDDPEQGANLEDDEAEREQLHSEKPAAETADDSEDEEMEELHLNHNMPSRGNDDDDDLALTDGELLNQPEVDLDDASTGETAGVYLGILNLYAAAPQLLGTLFNMIVFAIVEPGRNPELAHPEEMSHGNSTTASIRALRASDWERRWDVELPRVITRSLELLGRDHGEKPPVVNAIAVCMFIGGLSSLGAAYATRRLKFVR